MPEISLHMTHNVGHKVEGGSRQPGFVVSERDKTAFNDTTTTFHVVAWKRISLSLSLSLYEKGEGKRERESKISPVLSLPRFFWPPPSPVSTEESTEWKRSPEQNNSLSCWNRRCFTLVWGADSSGRAAVILHGGGLHPRNSRPDNPPVSNVCFEFLKRSAATAPHCFSTFVPGDRRVRARLWRAFPSPPPRARNWFRGSRHAAARLAAIQPTRRLRKLKRDRVRLSTAYTFPEMKPR